MHIHTSHAGLCLALNRRLPCEPGERVAADLVLALLVRIILAFSDHNTPQECSISAEQFQSISI